MKYLYKNNVEVYSIIFDKDKIIEYKKDKMKKIPEDERIYSGVSLDIDFKQDNIITKNKDRLYIKYSLEKPQTFYLYKNKSSNINMDNILNFYYEGLFNNLKAFKSDYLNETKYYLIDMPINKKNANRKTFGGIIQVPRELYCLQLLLNEEYNLLTKKDLECLKELYSVTKIREIPAYQVNLEKVKKFPLSKKLTRK